MRKVAYGVLAAGALTGQSVGAVYTIVDDKFADGGFSDGTDAKDIAWFGQDASAALAITPVTGDTTAIDGNTLRGVITGASTINRGFGGAFAPVTLAQNGDYVSMSVSFYYDYTGTNTSGVTVRTGLVNGGASQTTFDDDYGYLLSFNPATGATTRLVEQLGSSTTNLGSAFTGTSPDAVLMSLTLTITRVAAGIQFDMQGSPLTSSTVSRTITHADPIATPYTYTLNQLSVRLNGTDNKGAFYLDNVLVTTNVPEPASLTMLGLVGGALLRRRSR